MSVFIWLCVIVYDSVFMYIMYNLRILSSQRFIDMYPIVPDMAPWKFCIEYVYPIWLYLK